MTQYEDNFLDTNSIVPTSSPFSALQLVMITAVKFDAVCRDVASFVIDSWSQNNVVRHTASTGKSQVSS